MSGKFGMGPFGRSEAPRPSAAEAKAANERYLAFRVRLDRIAAAATKAGQEDLAEQLADLAQRVEDRETTLDEGQDELRLHEQAIRAMLRR